MSVRAITPDYEKHIQYRDVQELYHGALLVYVHWEQHISFVAAVALPLPPPTPFGALPTILKDMYGPHPDFEKIDWEKAVWMIDGVKVQPDFSKSIAENGVGHKSLIRFWTPGLNGWKGSCN